MAGYSCLRRYAERSPEIPWRPKRGRRGRDARWRGDEDVAPKSKPSGCGSVGRGGFWGLRGSVFEICKVETSRFMFSYIICSTSAMVLFRWNVGSVLVHLRKLWLVCCHVRFERCLSILDMSCPKATLQKYEAWLPTSMHALACASWGLGASLRAQIGLPRSTKARQSGKRT